MSEWKEYRFSDIAKLAGVSVAPEDAVKYPYIGLEHMKEGGFSLEGIGNAVDVISGKTLFREGDILFGKLRPYFRKVYKARFDGICSTDIWVIEAKNGFDQSFLFYLVANQRFVDILSKAASGTKMPRASWSYASKLMFRVPEPSEQRAIAGVLSSLDDKIELLRKQNETLEAMASALFKHWFVDFEFPNEDGKPYKTSGGAMIDSELGEIPEVWKVGKYGEIANLTMGLSPKGEFYNTDSEGLPLLNGASDFEGSKIKATKYTSEITRKCERGDIIFCIRATIGNIAIADKEYCLGRGVAAIRPNEDCFFYALYFLKMTLDRLAHSATGSVIKGLSKPDISGMRILKPKKEISRFFNSTINPVFEKLKTNTSEIDTLTRLRDLLLPKLMSGEIRVEGEA